MLRLKPDPTERTTIIFQEACRSENMEEKVGRGLSVDENDVRRYLLIQTPVLGRIPSREEIKEKFAGLTEEKLATILNRLDRLDVIHFDEDKNNVIAAYPFSGPGTSHVVSLGRKEFRNVYAMCAIDALGLSFMFDCDISIKSLCFHCKKKIGIDVKDGQIIFLNPRDTVVWCDMEYSNCAATSLCKNINFFSSEEHYEEWNKGRSKRKGYLLQIQEAFYLGKLFFEIRIK
jgi:hypothetical protein